MGRSAGQELKVFKDGGGYRIDRRSSREQAEMFEALGVWRREYDPSTGALLGFRIIGVEACRGDVDLKTILTTPTISPREMDLNVSYSQTFGMRELERMERLKAGKVPEDAAERVQAKVRVYPHVGAAKGDILRVWPA